jgi:hypothetical protein
MDNEAMLQSLSSSGQAIKFGIEHPQQVRCILPLILTPVALPYLLTGAGEMIGVWDISSFGELDGVAERIGEMDAHFHDVIALGLWLRKVKGEGGATGTEAWIVSASLDGTIRRWGLSGVSLCSSNHPSTILSIAIDLLSKKDPSQAPLQSLPPAETDGPKPMTDNELDDLLADLDD